ncbi:MAG: nucleotidyltransferase domain-containing protein [Candidatus Aenigmarchaeota archaeon]|nr:nucleotidyltransferase domain-containing protein [Candidatus Aenigmarchaeota archaeon]
MIYANYLNRILGNRTKIALLRIFCKMPDKVWTSRELARFIGTYNTTVLDNLTDFEEMDLLNISMHGHGKAIKVNKESFIFTEIVRPLFEAETMTLNRLIYDLKAMIDPKDVRLFCLFGSIAEHMEKPGSDIDIIIVTRKKGKIERLLAEKEGMIARKYGNELSVHIFSSKEFRSKQNTPFLREARKRHIVLHGRWV